MVKRVACKCSAKLTSAGHWLTSLQQQQRTPKTQTASRRIAPWRGMLLVEILLVQMCVYGREKSKSAPRPATQPFVPVTWSLGADTQVQP
jgi:hypothetical protein